MEESEHTIWGLDVPEETDHLLGDFSAFHSSDLPDGEAVPSKANVDFLNLKEDMCFDKVQCRRGGKPKQVLENAVIKMKATYGPQQLVSIRGWIRREPTAARLFNDQNREVLICDSMTGRELNLAEKSDRPTTADDDPRYVSQYFSVDLGKVYEGPTQPVFQLAKTETAKRNRFQLMIQLIFLPDEPSKVFVSPTFICRTKQKRRHSDGLDPGEPPSVRRPSPGSVYSPNSEPLSESSSCTIESPFSKNLIVDSLCARTAKIEDLVVGTMNDVNRITTDNADIAYHLHIKEAEIGVQLEEGDIVGFYTDEDSGGTYIKQLKSDDIGDAVHAGVISRSYYLAANKQGGYENATDTVCVIGIVNVKVIGSVENGERIYASIDRPGKAIPQSHLPVGTFLRKKHCLLGMAMERKHAKSLEEAHLVKCFVCIVLDTSRKEILEEVESLYVKTENSTQEQIRRASRRAWRRLQCCFIVLVVFVGLLSFLAYQVLAPGSMFRYWLCRKGSTCCLQITVDVNPFSDPAVSYHVHGIQFRYSDLEKKISEHFWRNNKTGGASYYFLNLDRCAYSGDRGPVGNFFGGYKEVGGGKVLSINRNCTIVYWFGHNKFKGGKLDWWPYKSARHLTCHPHPPYETT